MSEYFEFGFFKKEASVGSVISSAAKGLGHVAKKYMPGIAAGSLGWSAASNIFNNVTKGEELSGYKILDGAATDAMYGAAFLGGFKGLGMAGRGLGRLASSGLGAVGRKALHYGKMLPGGKRVSKAVGGIIAKAKASPRVDRIKAIAGTKNRIMDAGNNAIRAMGKDAPNLAGMTALEAKRYTQKAGIKALRQQAAKSKNINRMLIGAGIGGAIGYDPDAPISSTLKGAVTGGAAGRLLYGSHMGPMRMEYSVPTAAKEGIRSGLALGLGNRIVEKKQQAQQERMMEKYRKMLEKRQNEIRSFN